MYLYKCRYIKQYLTDKLILLITQLVTLYIFRRQKGRKKFIVNKRMCGTGQGMSAWFTKGTAFPRSRPAMVTGAVFNLALSFDSLRGCFVEVDSGSTTKSKQKTFTGTHMESLAGWSSNKKEEKNQDRYLFLCNKGKISTRQYSDCKVTP